MQNSLSASERATLEKGNDDFIGQAIREAKLWDERLDQKKEEEKQKYKGTVLENLDGLGIFPKDENRLAERYGMPKRPDAPERDYLACFHQQWDENKDPEILRDRLGFLKQKTCSFYYSFDKTRGEALVASEANRKDAQERRRFCVTTILIVVGIAVTIALGVHGLPKTEKSDAAPPTSAAQPQTTPRQGLK